MDTNVYGYMIAIAESKSISAASRKLYISQPALTKQLSRLEGQLGVKLYDRNTTSMSLTPAGEIFLEYSKKYVEFEKDLFKRLRKVNLVDVEKIRVATTHRGGDYVGNNTAPFLSCYSWVEVEYLDRSAEECERLLEKEEADIAIYTDPVISGDLEYMPLEEDPLVFVVPYGNPLLEGMDLKNNSLQSLLRVPAKAFRNPEITFVLATEDHSLYYAEQAIFRRHKITPVRPLQVDYVDTRYSVACGGTGPILVPFITASRPTGDKKVAYCTIDNEDLYRYVVIAKKKGRALSRGGEAFWKFMIGQSLKGHNDGE